MDCSPPGSSVHGIFRQEYWNGLPFSFPRNLPHPGIKPSSFALQTDTLLFEPLGDITLTNYTFVNKVISLLFNMLSRFAIGFLPKTGCLLILWLQSLSAEILEPKKIKSVTASTFSSSIFQEVMGSDAMIFVFRMLSFKPVFFTLIFHPHQEA